MTRRLAIAALAALVFLSAAVAVAAGATKSADRGFTVWLQTFASPALDQVANLNTLVGQSTVNAALMLVLMAVLFVRGPRWAWIAPLFLGLLTVVELAGKLSLVHPSPPDEFIRTSFNPLGIHLSTSSSFPSGHVSRVTFFAILLWELIPNAVVRTLLVALAIATPFLRIYLGDHWISDTVGGVSLGILCGTLAVQWLAATRRRAAAARAR